MCCLFLVRSTTTVKLPKGGCCGQDSSCAACHCLWGVDFSRREEIPETDISSK